MREFERNINSEVLNYNLFNQLKSLYESRDKTRKTFDSKDVFFILFNDLNELLIENITAVINENKLIKGYNDSGLGTLYGNDWKSIFTKSKFTAHTHPPRFEDYQLRPDDGDYSFIEEYGNNKPHYVIDEKYIFCINFQFGDGHGHYGKWQWKDGDTIIQTPLYVSDEHYDYNDQHEKIAGEKPDERNMTGSDNRIESASLKIESDGTIRLEVNK